MFEQSENILFILTVAFFDRVQTELDTISKGDDPRAISGNLDSNWSE